MSKLTPQQFKAINPHHSVWITASAGSGKTRVIIYRMLRLMLEGAKLDTIICMTFTKKAAQEMQTRLDLVLRHWMAFSICCPKNVPVSINQTVLSQYPDRAIPTSLIEHYKDLSEILGRIPTYEDIYRASMLGEAYAQNPTIIQTFHSFCHDLLARFPWETNTPIPLKIIDDDQAKTLWHQAVNQSLCKAEEQEDLRSACIYLLKDCPRLQDALLEKFGHNIPKPTINAPKSYKRPSMPCLSAEICQEDRSLYKTLDALSEEELEKKVWALHLHVQGFKNTLCQRWLDDLRVFYAQVDHGEIEKKKRDEHYAWSLILKEINNTYHDLKQSDHGGALDFNDLTDKARHLLESPETSGWVTYCLDRALCHVLIDEAQDTNAQQWALVRILIETLLINPQKTLCVVADPKQSIYGFQGADPEAFFAVRAFAQAWIEYHHGTFRSITFDQSFRSGSLVLHAINTAFQSLSLTPDPFIPHYTTLPWKGSVSFLDPFSDKETLVSQWINVIKQWLEKPPYLASTGGILEKKDILILFPRRTSVFQLFQEALSKEGLLTSIQGRFCENEAIQALCALAQWMLSPHDDEAMGLVLHSFFTELDPPSFFKLAYKRTKSLYRALNKKAIEEPESMWSDINTCLRQWYETMKIYRPYQALQHIIYGERGLSSLIARLGNSSIYAVQIFFDRLEAWPNPDNLTQFVQWAKNNDAMIQYESGTDVRLMTIHGSKGLESPIVILPDLPASLDKSSLEYWRLLYVALTRAQEDLYVSCLKTPKGWYTHLNNQWGALFRINHGQIPFPGQIKTHGSKAKNKDFHEDVDCLMWIHTPINPQFLPTNLTPILNTNLPIDHKHRGEKDKALLSSQGDPNTGYLLPEKLLHSSQIPHPKAPLSPVDTKINYFLHQQLGIYVHQLLDEFARTEPSSQRYQRLYAFLRHHGYGPVFSQRWAQRMDHILTHPLLAELFSKGQGEVEIVTLDQKIRRIDRLLITPNALWIVDFKTEKPPISVSNLEKNPAFPTDPGKEKAKKAWNTSPYKDQLDAYALLLKDIYPNHKIYRGIVWVYSGIIQWAPDPIA